MGAGKGSRGAYAGTFAYGGQAGGRFYRLAGGEMAEAAAANGRAKQPAFVRADVHPALVDADTFAAAQARLARTGAGKQTQHPHGHLLSGGILVRGH